MRWLKALGALTTLLALLGGVPAVLIAGVGNPWPPEGVSLMAPLTDNAIIGLLAVVAWVLWAQLVVCVLAEAVAAVRDRQSSDITIPGVLGIQQQLARVLVTSIVIAVASISTQAVTVDIARAETTTTSRPGQQTPLVDGNRQETVSDVTTAGDGDDEADVQAVKVTVQRGDTLWALAETHLGEGDRWDEIAALNEGKNMGDGRTFRSVETIRPGWELSLPADATSPGDNQGVYVVEVGDTLSEVALEEVGSANAWPELFEASKKLEQPVPLTDPDLIYPGQRIDLPDTVAPTSRERKESQSRPRQTTPDEVSNVPSRRQHNTDGDKALDRSADRSSTSPRALEGDAEPRTNASSPTAGDGPVRAETGTDVASREDGAQLPGWITPGLLGAGTLLAGSLLLALRRRRASQHRYRRPGRTVPLPDPALAAVEASVTVAGNTTISTIELVDDLLKRLGGYLVAHEAALPVLAAVEVTPAAVALHLEDPAAPPAGSPWVGSDDGLLWVIDRDIDLDKVGPAPATEDPAPWPLLITVGHDERGSTWLLNIEDLTVTVTGDPVADGDFARFIAADVACNPWSRDTALDVVGIAAEVAAMSPDRIRVRGTPDAAAKGAVAEAVNTIDRLNEYDIDTPTARARQSDPDLWPSRLVIVEQPAANEELHQLIGLISDHRGRAATAVVLTGPGSTEGFEINIDARRQLRIPSVNLAITAVGLTVEEVHGCAALLAQADDQSDSAPPDLAGGENWQELATVTGSLRNQYRISRGAVALEHSSSLLEEADEAYTSTAATTSADLDAVAPQVTQSVGEQVEDADPGLDSDLDAWFSDGCFRPRLRLLGPVEARTSGTPLDRRVPFYTEMLAYLVTRPYGATTDEVATAFGLELSRVRKDINILRDWLGANPAAGEKFIPAARHTPDAKSRGVGVYQVVDALVDIDLFRRLRVRGESRGSDAGIDDLTRALQLVAGRPFEKLRPGGWGWLYEGDRLDQHLVCAIADVAHVVVTHSLQVEDRERARTAAGIAMMAAPDEEVARLDLAAVLQSEGHGIEAERIIRDDVCNRSDDGAAPTELPERTEQIIDTRRWLHRKAI